MPAPSPRDPPAPHLRLASVRDRPPVGHGAGDAAADSHVGGRSAADERLVQAFQDGIPGAGAELYDRLLPVVDATVFRILGRREHDHADLVQSAFEQVVTTLSKRSFERGCTLAGWAAVIACHVGLNALRARRRERVVVDRDRPAEGLAAPDRGGGGHPEAQLGARDELAAVRRHLGEMDPDRVTALLLKAQGYDLVEIARLTQTSVAAAQSRVSRGRREIKERLRLTVSSAQGEADAGSRP
jgi:RNA polymerase sigma-70 factor, ECF subfamily